MCAYDPMSLPDSDLYYNFYFVVTEATLASYIYEA